MFNQVINAFGAYLGNKTGNVIPMGGFYFIPSHFPKTIYNGAFDAGVLDQLVSGLRNVWEVFHIICCFISNFMTSFSIHYMSYVR